MSKTKAARSAERLAAMRMNTIFSNIEPEVMAKLLQYASFQTFKRGDFIFRKGDPGTSLFGVITGSVRMSASSADGKNAVLNLIGAGRTFGEIAVLDGLDRTTDAIVNVDCELWRIERRDLMPLVQTHPALAARFIDLLCARLRWTSEHLEQVVLQGLKARLAHMILRMAEQNLQRNGILLVDMSQQNISDVVGIARESANKIISIWVEQNWVSVENRTLVILDADALRTIAGGT